MWSSPHHWLSSAGCCGHPHHLHHWCLHCPFLHGRTQCFPHQLQFLLLKNKIRIITNYFFKHWNLNMWKYFAMVADYIESTHTPLSDSERSESIREPRLSIRTLSLSPWVCSRASCLCRCLCSLSKVSSWCWLLRSTSSSFWKEGIV